MNEPGWEIENSLARDYGWETFPDENRGYGWRKFNKGDEWIWVRGDGTCVRSKKAGDRFVDHKKYSHLEAALNGEEITR